MAVFIFFSIKRHLVGSSKFSFYAISWCLRSREGNKDMKLWPLWAAVISAHTKFKEEDWNPKRDILQESRLKTVIIIIIINDIKAYLNNNILKSSSLSSSCRLLSSSCYILCYSCVYVANFGESIHQNTCAVLQASLRNLVIHSLQRLEMSNGWFKKKKRVFEDTWWERSVFLWIQKPIMQLKYKTTQCWPKHECFPERKEAVSVWGREEWADCFSQSCLLSISSLFSYIHFRYPTRCPFSDPSMSY